MLDGDGTVAIVMGSWAPGDPQHTSPASLPGPNSTRQRGASNSKSAAQEDCDPARAVPMVCGSILGSKRAADDNRRGSGPRDEEVAAAVNDAIAAFKRRKLETRIPAPCAAAPMEATAAEPDTQRDGRQAGPCSDVDDIGSGGAARLHLTADTDVWVRCHFVDGMLAMLMKGPSQ